jgi:hypothetical protein
MPNTATVIVDMTKVDDTEHQMSAAFMVSPTHSLDCGVRELEMILVMERPSEL